MITQLSYRLNRCFKKSKLDFLIIRNFDEFDNKLAQCLKNHNIWLYSLSNAKQWNFKEFIPKENIVFVNHFDYFNIDYIILPHFDDALDAIKFFPYIPKISLYHDIPPFKNNSKLEKQFSELSLAPSKEVAKYWKLNKDYKIIPNWDNKILTKTIEEFCESSSNSR